MNSDVDIKLGATFKDLQDQISGSGQKLPLEVIFKRWPEEDGWIEPGMKAYIVDVIDFGDGFGTQVYFYFGEHEEYNLKFFKKEFYSKGNADKKVDALKSGNYEKRTYVLFQKDYKFHEYLKLT